MLLIEEYGEEIEFDLQQRLGVDLGDYFRGRRPWQQLIRFLRRLPMDSWYQSALAMDEEIGWARAQRKLPDKPEPISPQGYSLEVLTLVRTNELIKELLRVLPAVFGGKLPPPFPPEPRPQSAEQRFRDAIEKIELTDAVNAILGDASN